MSLRFDKTMLKQAVAHLTAAQRFIFLLLSCERMMPTLRQFAHDTNFDASESEMFVQDGWAYLARDLQGGEKYLCFDPNNINVPDHERYSHPLTYAALNAAVGAGCLASFMAAPNVESVVEGASLAFDTAFQYVQSTVVGNSQLVMSGRALKERAQEWAAHPISQRELQSQSADLGFVSAMPRKVSELLVKSVKDRAESQLPTIPL